MVLCQAGTTLQQLSSTMDPITVESVALLVAFALLSLGRSSKTTSLILEGVVLRFGSCLQTPRVRISAWCLPSSHRGRQIKL